MKILLCWPLPPWIFPTVVTRFDFRCTKISQPNYSLFATFIRGISWFRFSLNSVPRISTRIISPSLLCDRFNNIITKGITESTRYLRRVQGWQHAEQGGRKEMAHFTIVPRQGETVKEKGTDWPVAGETQGAQERNAELCAARPVLNFLRNRIQSPATSSQLLISCSLGFHFSSSLFFPRSPFSHPPLSAERIVTDLLEQDDEANLVHCMYRLRGGSRSSASKEQESTTKTPFEVSRHIRRDPAVECYLLRPCTKKSRFPFLSVSGIQ